GLLPRGPFRVSETLLMEYVPPEAFGEDYLYFYDVFLPTRCQTLRRIDSGACSSSRAGTGGSTCPAGTAESRTGSPPAGASVTGLDANPLFLERARTDAAA